MSISIETPALLFPTISLLFLSYTNKYLALANLIRQLHKEYLNNHESVVIDQIKSLKERVNMIKNMQLFGIVSLLLSTISMAGFYFEQHNWGQSCFALALVALFVSLWICFAEVRLSVKALNIRLKDIEN